MIGSVAGWWLEARRNNRPAAAGCTGGGDDHCLFIGREHSRARRLRSLRRVMHEGTLAPLRDRLGIQSMLCGNTNPH